VVTYSLWQNKLKGDPAIIGKTVDLDGYPTPVVGVLPRNFREVPIVLGFERVCVGNEPFSPMRISGNWRPKLLVRRGELENQRHDADDFIADPVDRQRFAKCITRTVKPVEPQSMAQDYDSFLPLDLLGCNGATKFGPNAMTGKKFEETNAP
jgi:hypothetical protein